jgi:hypothetical protein
VHGEALWGDPPASAWTYLATRLTVWIDGEPVRAAEAVARLGAPLHLITAWNPYMEPRTAVENAAANARLEAELLALGPEVWPARGEDPTDAYLEDGFAARGLDRATALRIGADHRQEAIFELDASHRTVIECAGVWAVAREV